MSVCPCCGYCPHCGRKNNQYPYQYPYTITTTPCQPTWIYGNGYSPGSLTGYGQPQYVNSGADQCSPEGACCEASPSA